MRREGDSGSIVKDVSPTVVQSTRKTSKGGKTDKTPPKPLDDSAFASMALSPEEYATFCMAIQDLSDLADQGLWHIGLDTDPDVPDRFGNPGVEIWHMESKEVKKVADLFMVLGKQRPEVYKMMRAVNQSHAYLQAGLIVGSRFFQTGMRLFEVGVNFRMSKAAWTQTVNRGLQNATQQ